MKRSTSDYAKFEYKDSCSLMLTDDDSRACRVQGCRGYAPRYPTSQKGRLRQVLFAARHILLECFGKLEDSRTGEDVIQWMLQVGNSAVAIVVRGTQKTIPKSYTLGV